jgi:hypothetical protein
VDAFDEFTGYTTNYFADYGRTSGGAKVILPPKYQRKSRILYRYSLA